MKILFTGGGSGGHFYPIIAVAQKINKIIEDEKILDAKLYYMSNSPYSSKILYENGILFRKTSAGKLRRYFSINNFFDVFRTFFGSIKAIFELYAIYPDVVFSKGGFASFPTLFAAKILRIPVVIHESDSVPGRTNLWAGKFAKRIALSYKEAAEYFPADKTAYTGQPIRKEIEMPLKSGAKEYLGINDDIPVIMIMGGSLGARIINESIIDVLPDLVSKYQVIHQVGNANVDEMQKMADVVLHDNPNKNRYRVFGYLNDLSMKMTAGISSLVISRAGSTIFEISAWGLPSIIIPITDSNGDHQRKNAYNYARSGAANVIEEKNLTPHVLLDQIEKLMMNKALLDNMSKSAKEFYKSDAAEKIAREIVNIALEHENV